MSLNYVTLGSNDVVRARQFYDAVLPIIGGQITAEIMPHAFCYILQGGGRIWVVTPQNRAEATVGNGNMVGLACESAEVVRAGMRRAWNMAARMKVHPELVRNTARSSSALTSAIRMATRSALFPSTNSRHGNLTRSPPRADRLGQF